MSSPAPEHKYSVLVLRLNDYRPARPFEPRKTADGSGPGLSAPRSSGAPSQGNNGAAQPDTGRSQELVADAASAAPRAHRDFVLPPVQGSTPVKQTIIQPDVPPQLQITREIPLPTVLLWERLPPLRKKFVAPAPVEKPRNVANVPTAPEITTPNREIATADLKIADLIAKENAKLMRPPARTTPLKGTSMQPIAEPPQIALSSSPDTSVAALISLPSSPITAAQTVAVPPANQIAQSGGGGAGTSSGSRSSSANSASGGLSGRDKQPGQGGTTGGVPASNPGTPGTGGARGNGGSGSGGPLVSGLSGSGAVPGSGTARGSGTTPGGTLSGLSGSGGNGLNFGTGPGTEPGTVQELPLTISGTTRLTLPKDGKFGVVVTGSALAAPYAESVGALSGRMIYSVYVGVGLRKKWILQYCLGKAEEQKTSLKGSTQPIGAPWPYVVVRPDKLGIANRDYVIVRGVLTSEGRFDQLGLVFPVNIEEKDLLMSSLKQWTFRPATRDGVPSEVEVLLIIPGQSD